MCGIVGVYREDNLSNIDQMIDCLSHRGPDERGKFVNKDVPIAMGVRRLSIIDLENGSQPIKNEDGSIVAIFNGEIYNHLDLRKRLLSKGHNFKTECDTEVLVHLWEEYGRSMPKMLNGMFAFAIFDSRQESVFIARDRLGIKPLYYSIGENGLCWSSELESLLKADMELTLDQDSIYNYFNLRYFPHPQTPFNQINKLPPGSSIYIEGSNTQMEKYWENKTSEQNGSIESFASELKRLLRKSVSNRLMSDVPVGAFLSGGLDSTAIVGIMDEISDEQINTFSVGFSNDTHDESKHAKYVSEHYETKHNQITVDLESVDMLEQAISHFGEPLADPAVLPTFILSELASESVKVVLTEEGADELFGDYWYLNKIPHHKKIFNKFPAKTFRTARYISRHSPVRQQTLRYVGSFENDTELVKGVSSKFQPYVDEYVTLNSNSCVSGLNKMVNNNNNNNDDDDDNDNNDNNNISQVNNSFERKMVEFDLKYWLPDDLLYKIDHTTMAASLEARVPFLSHEIVEFATKIPIDYRTDGYKPVLNQAVADIVPDKIRKREKKGFTVPVDEWFRSDHEMINKWMSEEKISQTPFINSNSVYQMWSEHKNRKDDHSGSLWKILNFVAWYHSIGKKYL